MLLRTAALEHIVRGEVSLVFRRWRRPTVRTGGSLRTALGVLRILEVAAVEEQEAAMLQVKTVEEATDALESRVNAVLERSREELLG